MNPFGNDNTGGPGLVNKKPAQPGEVEMLESDFTNAGRGTPLDDEHTLLDGCEIFHVPYPANQVRKTY